MAEIRSAAGRRSGGENRHRTDATVGGVAAEVGVALADGHGDHAVGEMRIEDDARIDLTVVGLDRHQLALVGAEAFGGGRGHLEPGAPGGLEQRFRDLL